MPTGSEDLFRSASGAPTGNMTTLTDLPVDGTLPAGLSGQYTQVGRSVVEAYVAPEDRADSGCTAHAIRIGAKGTVSYRSRWIDADLAQAKLVTFGKTVYALVEGELACEVSGSLETVQRVDLAGAGRPLAAHATVDARTGELHLLAFAGAGPQLRVAVSRAALTRTLRSVGDTPSRVHQLALSHDEIVFLADGFIGIAPHAGSDTSATWYQIDTHTHHMAMAVAHRNTVVVHAVGPSLVRWSLDRQSATAHQDVLDPMPQNVVAGEDRRTDVPRRFLWTVGAHLASTYDLTTGRRCVHDFGDGRTPCGLVFVADPHRRSSEDGGWLVGTVRDDAHDSADFVVLDAQAIERPALASVRLPHHLLNSHNGTWVPG